MIINSIQQTTSVFIDGTLHARFQTYENRHLFGSGMSGLGLMRAYRVVTPSQNRWLFSGRKWGGIPDFGIMKAIRQNGYG